MSRPPFVISNTSVTLCGEILRLVGRYEGMLRPTPQPRLRRNNRIRTIMGTVQIEGNTLTLGEVSALLDGKRVLGPKDEVIEVQNAIAAYAQAVNFKPAKVDDLRRAHGILTARLQDDSGSFRRGGVGVFRGEQVQHVAPPADRVPHLVDDVLRFYRTQKDVPELVRSAVLHYELAFIHPFSDGNGRIARLWHHVALLQYAPIFEFVPMESVIRARQQEYYETLARCDRAGNSTEFIDFALQALLDALAEFLAEVHPEPTDVLGRLAQARDVFGHESFSRKQYMHHFKTLSSATASRDLRRGIAEGFLVASGSRALTRYCYR